MRLLNVRLAALLLPLMLGAGRVDAKDMSGLYSTEELQTWHYILELQTQRNFEIVRTQGLSGKERQRASAVRLEMPLRGPEKDVIEYFAENDTIVLPVLSLKFLNDILLANAWLYAHGYDPRTIDDYVSMLKYRKAADFSLGRYPRPLDVLEIPQSPEGGIILGSDPKVEYAFFAIANVASGFIMAHELGHVVLGHTRKSAGTFKERLREEQDADAFALRALSRIGSEVSVMMMFFTLTSSWSPMVADFPSREEYERFLREANHPVNGERIRALARRAMLENDAQTQRIGQKMMLLGDLIDNESYQRALAARGRSASLSSLRRRPTGLPLPPAPWPDGSK